MHACIHICLYMLFPQVRRFCRETNSAFTDPDFPPAVSSLFADGKGWRLTASSSSSSRHRAGLDEILWLRCAQDKRPLCQNHLRQPGVQPRESQRVKG